MSVLLQFTDSDYQFGIFNSFYCFKVFLPKGAKQSGKPNTSVIFSCPENDCIWMRNPLFLLTSSAHSRAASVTLKATQYP